MLRTLADFYQDPVGPLLQFTGSGKTVQSGTIKPLPTSKDSFAIDPDRHVVVSPAPQLGFLIAWRVNFGIGVADRFLDRSKDLDLVCLAEAIGVLVRLQANGAVLTGIGCRQVDFLFWGKDLGKTTELRRVKGSQQVPAIKEPHLLDNIDLNF